jgi:hypothetical protein
MTRRNGNFERAVIPIEQDHGFKSRADSEGLKNVHRMLHRLQRDTRPAVSSRFGLEESGARTAVDAKRPKSILSEGARQFRLPRPSLIDFSGAGIDVSPSLHSRDLFGSFFDLAKNEPPSLKTNSCLIAKQNV